MIVRFPPIAALRAFESAARHLNYTRAAEELHVTQSAISHQIKHAEELWEVKLFERRGRRLVLTEAGHALVPVVRDFIRRITSTLEELHEKSGPTPMRVTLLQSFAFKWLVPRLGLFNAQHPEIEVWISISDGLTNFDQENADVGIRLGYGNWQGLFEERILQEYVFPVCSPGFLEEHPQLNKPDDLLSVPLLRCQKVDITPRWRDWFYVAGIRVHNFPKGSKFPTTSLALQAALDDQGVALVRSAHVQDDLQAGRLIRIFPQICLRSSVSYYFVCLRGRENEDEIKLFRNWLVELARGSQQKFEEMMKSDCENSQPG